VVGAVGALPAIVVIGRVRGPEVVGKARNRAWPGHLDAAVRVVVGLALPAERVVVGRGARLAVGRRFLAVNEELGAPGRPVPAGLVLDPPHPPPDLGAVVVVPMALLRIPAGGEPAAADLALVHGRSGAAAPAAAVLSGAGRVRPFPGQRRVEIRVAVERPPAVGCRGRTHSPAEDERREQGDAHLTFLLPAGGSGCRRG